MILLDTQVWVRWVDPQANPLSPGITDCIGIADQLAVNAVTCWEVTWLARQGRLQLKLSLPDWLDQALPGSGVLCIPVDWQIAVGAASLPEHHRDPADRLIIATAIERQARLISLDNVSSGLLSAIVQQLKLVLGQVQGRFFRLMGIGHQAGQEIDH